MMLGGGNHTEKKVHAANMGPIWGRQGPGGPHVGHMNFAIWAANVYSLKAWLCCIYIMI